MSNLLPILEINIKSDSGESFLVIKDEQFSVSELRLTDFLEEDDFRRYECRLNSRLTSITINCGANPPYIFIESMGKVEINHEFQNRIISLFESIIYLRNIENGEIANQSLNPTA